MEYTENELTAKLKKLIQEENPDYRAIFKLTRDLSKLDKMFQHFFMGVKILILLGRDSIKDQTTELIKTKQNK